MGKIYQFHTAFAVCYTSILVGLLNVWPSYTITIYKADNGTLLSAPLTELDSSLLGSLPSLGGMVGTAIVGPIIDRVGRKKGGLILFFPFVLTWAAIELTSSMLIILIARFISGIPCGCSLVYAAIYISEVSEDSIRGTLASGPVLLYCLGALFSYLFGWFLSYYTILYVNIVASIFCLLLFMTVVESPVFLLKNNREEEARAALSHYRGLSPASQPVLEELSRLKQQIMPAVKLVSINNDYEKVEQAEKEKLNTDNEEIFDEKDKMPSWKLLFVTPSSRQAFLVVAFTVAAQVFMGMVPVQVYAKELFKKAAPDLSPHLCSVLFAIVLLAGSLVTTLVADKAGRRILIIISSVMVSIFMVCLGILLQTNIAPAWVSALTLLIYCFSFYFGAGTVPYVLLTEVFVPEVQGIASMLIVEMVWFLNFFILAIFPYANDILGIHGVFYIFGAFGVANTVFCYFMLPETKGLSTQQIQELFVRRKI